MKREHLKFELTVLGSNSALPKSNRFPSAQILNIREKLFLIDCGEGTQMQLRKFHHKFSRINHIFISHLHGDHVFGLPGLISSFNLLGRKATLTIHAHKDLQNVLETYLGFFEKELHYNLEFVPFNARKNELIYEDNSVEVYTIPLKHRIPTAGFLFKEKMGDPNMRKDAIEKYGISLSEIQAIKSGSDLVLESGVIIPNSELTTPPPEPRTFAYCSDTVFIEKNAELLREVDLLYHEATFGDDCGDKIKKTGHSTARQAGKLAALAEVKQLLIGHYSARYHDTTQLLNEAKEEFDNTVMAYDGLRINII